MIGCRERLCCLYLRLPSWRILRWGCSCTTEKPNHQKLVLSVMSCASNFFGGLVLSHPAVRTSTPPTYLETNLHNTVQTAVGYITKQLLNPAASSVCASLHALGKRR